MTENNENKENKHHLSKQDHPKDEKVKLEGDQELQAIIDKLKGLKVLGQEVPLAQQGQQKVEKPKEETEENQR